jgi:hypothetical protein
MYSIFTKVAKSALQAYLYIVGAKKLRMFWKIISFFCHLVDVLTDGVLYKNLSTLLELNRLNYGVPGLQGFVTVNPEAEGTKGSSDIVFLYCISHISNMKVERCLIICVKICTSKQKMTFANCR